jgi:hypothetical protein
MNTHKHSYSVISRVKDGDIITITWRCSCGDTYVTTEHT